MKSPPRRSNSACTLFSFSLLHSTSNKKARCSVLSCVLGATLALVLMPHAVVATGDQPMPGAPRPHLGALER